MKFQALYAFLRENLSLDSTKMLSANLLRDRLSDDYSVQEIKRALHYVFGDNVVTDNFKLVHRGERWYLGLVMKGEEPEELPVSWRIKPEVLKIRGENVPVQPRYFKRYLCKKSPGSVLPLNVLIQESKCSLEDLKECFHIVGDVVYDVQLRNDISSGGLNKSTATPELFLSKFCRKSSCFSVRAQDLQGAFAYWRRTIPAAPGHKIQPMVFKADWEGEFVAGYKFNKRGLEWWEKYAADQEKPTLRENLHVKMD